MDKYFNFVRNNNGVIKLPPGFRFQPTDEELVFQYLRRKIFSCPMPSSSDHHIIPEINVCKYDPWDLPSGDIVEQERYYFSNKEAKYRNGSNKANRKTNSGYWKSTGSDKKIVSSTMKHIVGTRKTLVFYRGKPPHGSRTDWFMHEYSLNIVDVEDDQTNSGNNFPQISQSQTENNWVLCRIFLKERSSSSTNNNINNIDEIQQNWKDNKMRRSVGINDCQPYKLYDLVMGCEIDTSPMLPLSSSSSSNSSYVTEDHEVSSSGGMP
ncbi:NAC domain-containing protein 29 [Morus notabilis]|uniref:NAC domain-containing protein 29 n=1 Tax=Morus notabilis TaxID=981085 RepID=W9R2Y4_9ROSA|nr:NAC domain-containing protein 83 [Morus notabilis]EXB54901.1 NAC domain-containing protein 29 [Morus notabilis]